MKFEESRNLFNEALSYLKAGNVLKAFDIYCDALINRICSGSPDLDFSLFYRSQLIKYLRAKKSLILSLPEGDMISDLIYSVYEDFVDSLRDNPFIRTERGRMRLLMSVKIVFPIQNDSELDELPQIVSK